MRWWIVFGLVLLFVSRIDLWWFDSPRLMAGLPIGLAYHLAFCFLIAGFFACVVKFAWPSHLESVVPPHSPGEGSKVKR